MLAGNETVTIIRRTGSTLDDFGMTVFTTQNIEISGCLVGFGSSSEPVDINRDAIDSDLTLYLPQGTEIQEGDKFLVRGEQWVKDGSPHEWQAPFAFDVGVVLKIRKRNG
jgi:hypothetical protein